MSIKINELKIRLTVVEPTDESSHLNQKISAVKLQELKSAIVNECTSKVFERIKERTER